EAIERRCNHGVEIFVAHGVPQCTDLTGTFCTDRYSVRKALLLFDRQRSDTRILPHVVVISEWLTRACSRVRLVRGARPHWDAGRPDTSPARDGFFRRTTNRAASRPKSPRTIGR